MFQNFGRLLMGGVIIFLGLVISVAASAMFQRPAQATFFPGAYPNFYNNAYAAPQPYAPQPYGAPASAVEESAPAESAPEPAATEGSVPEAASFAVVPFQGEMVEPRALPPRREMPANRPSVIDVEYTDHKVDWRKPRPETIEMVNGIPVIPKSTWAKLIPSFLQVREDTTDDPTKAAIKKWWMDRVVCQLRGPMYPEHIEDLVMKSVRDHTPGTEEFYATHEPHLRGVIPQGVLVPKIKPLMLPAHEEALITRYGWHRECEYLDYYSLEYDEQVDAIMESEQNLFPYRNSPLPDDWEDQIEWHLCAIEQHIGGYAEADRKRAFEYLTLIFAIRNNNWGMRRTTNGEMTMSLFKFGVFRFREMLYKTPSLDADQAQIEHVADSFEELLNLITIPNKPRKDWLLHTPMIRVSKLPPGEREKLGPGWMHPSEIHDLG
jgi:hypothetical protein